MGVKRAWAVGGSPSKRLRGETVNARAKRVVEALLDEELPSDVPQAAREMLALGAKNALATCMEDRHQMQSNVCGHIKEAFGDILSHLQAEAEKVKASAATVTAGIEACQAAADAARGALSEAEAATSEQQAKLAEQRLAAKAEENGYRTSKAAHDAVLKACAAIEKEQARRAGVAEGLQKLLAGGLDPKEAKKEAARLVKLVERLGAESALVAALPEVLTKTPEERKGFDELVLQSLDGFVKGLLAAVEAELAENQTKLTEAETELLGNEAVLEKVTGELEAEQAKLSELQVALTERQEAERAADDKVAEVKEAGQEQLQQVDEADATLAEFSSVLETLTGLLERSSAPPPEEAAAAEAAAGAA